MGLDVSVVMHDGGMILERRGGRGMDPFAAARILRGRPGRLRTIRGVAVAGGMAAGAAILRRLRLVGRRRTRADAVQFGDGLLAPVRGVPLQGLIADVESCQVCVQGHVPRDVAPTVAGTRDGGRRSCRRLRVVEATPKGVTGRRLRMIQLHRTGSADGRGEGSLRNHLVETFDARQARGLLSGRLGNPGAPE